jgi:hypothetical protein
MTTVPETLLIHELQSRLHSAIATSVAHVGSDDLEELIQDGLVITLRLHRRAQELNKRVSAANLVFYAVRLLRAGRRSTGQRRTDPLAPACQLSGRSQVCSLDCPVKNGDHGEEEALTLHDCLAAPDEDPAIAAARRLDWEILIRSLDKTAKTILLALAQGRELIGLVSELKQSNSTLHTRKRRLGLRIREELGPDILSQAQARPSWTSDLDAGRQRLACRSERRAP